MDTKNKYSILHCHTMLSSGTTNIDSVTSYKDYIKRASEDDSIYNLTFSEHGNIFEWFHKKEALEKAGYKYIHAVEAYITESLSDKVRDNYHCLLFAKNYEGFKELNRLVSRSFNRADVICYDEGDHFYYSPRITYDELVNTSDNIIVSTACMAGILSKGNEDIKNRFLKFLIENKHRCYLEVQHHPCKEQADYNSYLANVAILYDIPLLACTDTHSLNETHAEGRSILQKSKKVFFENETEWDLVYKTYDELIDAFHKQGALRDSEIESAINNTNKLVDSIESFEIDFSPKYPKLYENSVETFKQKINEAYKNHPYVKRRYSKKRIQKVVNEELDVYKKVGSIDFMLLQTYIREWEREQGIQCGYGRGSVSGSEIAYLLGITQMDSLKFDLNFFRFANPSRISNADIDSDFSEQDREKEKYFLLHDHMNLPQIQTSEIITFNTVAMKGAIKDVCRALEIPLDEAQEISNAVYLDDNKQWQIDSEWRERYPEVFKYVDIISGVVVSVGTHPSGVLVSDKNLYEEVGLCSLKTSDYPVSMLNMKELDTLFYVKLDILGLDGIGVINDTCKLLGIERLTPDNTDLNDEDVWRSIRDDTTMIFQWESKSAQSYLKKFMSDDTLAIAKKINPDFSYIKWFSFGNGLIRPGCASFRDDVADGNVVTTGFKELDSFLATTMGRIVMQEDIMQFLVRFCGYSDAESDNVRRCVDENTLITMGNGNLKPIKDIKVGDTVQCINENNNSEYRKVLNVFDNGKQECYEVKTTHSYSVIATKDHKVLTQDGYKKIEDLDLKEDLIASLANKKYVFLKIQSINKVGIRHVYDIEVEHNHNYIANDLIVHNCIAKKQGTQNKIDDIHDSFISYSYKKYGVPKSTLEEIFPPIKQGILDATYYAFSWNHSDAYSCIGYICGYLRYYHPLEFITSALNVFKDKEEKTLAITAYAHKVGIEIKPISFRKSVAEYSCNAEENCIYKGIASIKYLNSNMAEELYELRDNKYDDFINVLLDIDKTSVNSKQLTILIKLDFFREFGDIHALLKQVEIFNAIVGKKQFKKEKLIDLDIPMSLMREYAEKETEKMFRGIDSVGLAKRVVSYTKYDRTSTLDKIGYQQELLGYIQLTIPTIREAYAYVQDIRGKDKRTVKLYRLKTGEVDTVRVRKKVFNTNPFEVGDVIKTIECSEENKWRYDKENDKFYQIDEKETLMTKWAIVNT